MGNCFGAQQVNTHSPAATKPPSPQEIRKKNEVVKEINNGSSRNGNPNNRSSNGHNSPRNKSVKRDDDVATPPASKKTDSISPNVKVFSFAELRSATRNFRPDSVLGEGGFGRVFKGWVDEKTYAPTKVGLGMPVAVKKCNSDSIQGLEEWQSEVKFLGKFTHPNLVRLVGYCWEDREYLLVYEYMQKGSLENHLFRKTAEPISWEIRLKIALGAAEGLAFLHNSENHVIYRDFKASNILLDLEYNAKLSDFGLAKFGPANGNSHLSTRIMGTYGYAAPEYVATGHLYVKSDVYGFGVVLLEILTGLKAHDTNRPSGEHNLIDWAKPSLWSKRKLKKIMDPRLEDRYPMTAAFQASQLILKCLEAEPKNRPSMDDVLHILGQVSSIKLQQKDFAGSSSSHTPQRQVKRSSDGSYHKHGRSPRHSKYDGGRGHHRSPDPRSL